MGTLLYVLAKACKGLSPSLPDRWVTKHIVSHCQVDGYDGFRGHDGVPLPSRSLQHVALSLLVSSTDHPIKFVSAGSHPVR